MRLGAAKKRVVDSLMECEGEAFYPELLWMYNEKKLPSSDISGPTKSTFSKNIKKLKEEGVIEVVDVSVDDISDADYLNLAINKASSLEVKLFRSQILPAIFDKHLRSGDRKILNKTISSLENFVLNQNLELQVDEFKIFKDFFTDFSTKVDKYLCDNFSQIASKLDDVNLIKDTLFKVNSVISAKYSTNSDRALFFLLKDLSVFNSDLKRFFLSYRREIKGNFQNLYKRFERKNMYFHYCSSASGGQNNSFHFKINPHSTESFIKDYAEALDGNIMSLDEYLQKNNISKDRRKRAFRNITAENDYLDYIRREYLDSIFDKNWCRSRTEKKVILKTPLV